MASSLRSVVLRQMRRLAARDGVAKLPDGELLERFVTQHDQATFEALLARHGPLVLNVCRRVLPDPHAVEDAFQATFLVLARKARSIRKRELLSNWLHGVAYRTASRAKVEAAKRRVRESQVRPRLPADPLAEMTVRELFAALDEELQRLPTHCRVPLLLCYLEGKTRNEAARQLGWSSATLGRRLEQGRQLLRTRLARRGLTLTVAFFPSLLSQSTASAGVPTSLLATTLEAATTVAAGGAAASVGSAEVAVLMEGVSKAMLMSKLKIAALVFLTLTLVGGGVGVLALSALQAKPTGAAHVKWGPVHEGVRKAQGKDAKEPPKAQGKETRTDQEKLQGIWAIVNLVERGKEHKGITGGVEIAGNKLVMTSVLGESEYTFVVDASKKPKWIEVTGAVGNTKGDNQHGIYRLQGDLLTLCLAPTAEKRPTRFDARPEPGLTLTLQRLPPARETDPDQDQVLLRRFEELRLELTPEQNPQERPLDRAHEEEVAAVQFVEGLGGKVHRYKDAAGEPVLVVRLEKTEITDKGLKKLVLGFTRPSVYWAREFGGFPRESAQFVAIDKPLDL